MSGKYQYKEVNKKIAKRILKNKQKPVIFCIVRLYFKSQKTLNESGIKLIEKNVSFKIGIFTYQKKVIQLEGVGHMASNEIFYLCPKGISNSSYYYSYIRSYAAGSKSVRNEGGIILLPFKNLLESQKEKKLAFLDVVTWNTGQLENKNCSNKHHAEFQFLTWLAYQGENFIKNISGIEVHNQGFKSQNTEAYSPCFACTADLSKFIKNSFSVPQSENIDISDEEMKAQYFTRIDDINIDKRNAIISWKHLYRPQKCTALATCKANITELRKNWTITIGSPQKPLC